MCIHRECQINTHRTSHHWHVSCATERFHSDVNYVILDDSCIINTLTRLPMNDHHSAAFPACLNPWSGARSKSCPLPKSREVSHPCVTRVTWDFARSDIKPRALNAVVYETTEACWEGRVLACRLKHVDPESKEFAVSLALTRKTSKVRNQSNIFHRAQNNCRGKWFNVI